MFVRSDAIVEYYFCHLPFEFNREKKRIHSMQYLFKHLFYHNTTADKQWESQLHHDYEALNAFKWKEVYWLSKIYQQAFCWLKQWRVNILSNLTERKSFLYKNNYNNRIESVPINFLQKIEGFESHCLKFKRITFFSHS